MAVARARTARPPAAIGTAALLALLAQPEGRRPLVLFVHAGPRPDAAGAPDPAAAAVLAVLADPSDLRVAVVDVRAHPDLFDALRAQAGIEIDPSAPKLALLRDGTVAAPILLIPARRPAEAARRWLALWQPTARAA